MDGTTKPYNEPQDCNWGEISSHVVMTTAVVSQEQAVQYRMLLDQLSEDFGKDGDYNDIFHLFSSAEYAESNVMFTDATEKLHKLAVDENYYRWVGE